MQRNERNEQGETSTATRDGSDSPPLREQRQGGNQHVTSFVPTYSLKWTPVATRQHYNTVNTVQGNRFYQRDSYTLLMS